MYLFKPQEINLYDVLPGPKSGKADQEDGELSDDGCDDDGEADGAVAVPLEEGHQETKARKQHDVNVNNHQKNIGYSDIGGIFTIHKLGYWLRIAVRSSFLIRLGVQAESADLSYLGKQTSDDNRHNVLQNVCDIWSV